MKVLNKTLVAASIASAVLATGAAQAATLQNFPSTAAAGTFAETIINETVRTTVDGQTALDPTNSGAAANATNQFALLLGAGEILNEDDLIVLTLSNGAEFGAIASDSLLASADAAEALAPVSLISGGAGQSTATFRVGAAGIPANTTIQLSDGGTGTAVTFDLSGVPASGSVTLTADLQVVAGVSLVSAYGSPLTYNAYQLAPAVVATVTTAASGNNTTFDVATGFSTLVGQTAPSASAAGTVTFTDNAAAIANTTTTGVPTGVPTPGNNLITISGPMTGVASITSANIAGATATGAASSPAVAGGASIDTGSNTAWATTTATGAHPIVINFDGSVAYDASSYTVAASRTTDAAGYTANSAIGNGTLVSFTRNGSSFSTNSFGPLNKMTVTDRSGGLGGTGADGAINITAYAADGTVATCTGLSIPNIPNNGTVTIQGADVINACPGAKRIEGIVNSTSIQTTSTKITADGATSQSGTNSATTIAN